jgi:hypothetical protein
LAKIPTSAGFSYNNAREHFSSTDGLYDANGNPTRTLTEPLVNGGQFAPESGGSGRGRSSLTPNGSST